VDPLLEPVSDAREHEVACLLPQSVRSSIWRGLASGKSPADLHHLAVDRPGVTAAASPLVVEANGE
jgi:hypothetical protein